MQRGIYMSHYADTNPPMYIYMCTLIMEDPLFVVTLSPARVIRSSARKPSTKPHEQFVYKQIYIRTLTKTTSKVQGHTVLMPAQRNADVWHLCVLPLQAAFY